MTAIAAFRDAILDTNIVLDWLVFNHPDARALGAALEAGELQWIATLAMRDEFFHVLGRGALDDWQPDLLGLNDLWNDRCRLQLAPASSGPASLAAVSLRCTDPDDQKFIDLAAAHPGSLLLSRDRAVLKLAPRLAKMNVSAMPLARWTTERTRLALAQPC